jgi:hypothetical protein
MNTTHRPLCLIAALPRSYTSCICAALGQHPGLHGFPELNLFVAPTVGELLDEDAQAAGRGEPARSLTSGLLRAIAHLENRGIAPTSPEGFAQADARLRERRDWTTVRLLDHLLQRAAPAMGIDKSPRTLLAQGALERALISAPQAHILHLVRHPVDVAASLARTRRVALPTSAPMSVESFGLHLWIHANRRILQATAALPPGRVMRVRAEDVLHDPEGKLADIADWLGVGARPEDVAAMLHPERSPYANLALEPTGNDNDLGFLQSPALRRLASIGEPTLPRAWRTPPWLEEEARELARAFGYAMPPSA